MLVAEPEGAVLTARLLVGGDHQEKVARRGTPAAVAEARGRRNLRGHLALHVEGAPPADPAVGDVAGPGVEGPLVRIGADGVSVAEEGQRRPVARTAEPCDQVGATGLGGELLALEPGGGQHLLEEILNRTLVSGRIHRVRLDQATEQIDGPRAESLRDRSCGALLHPGQLKGRSRWGRAPGAV